jgi:hypothetical protein
MTPRGLWLLALLALGCVPSFEQFRRIHPGEDAGSLDGATGRDAGAMDGAIVTGDAGRDGGAGDAGIDCTNSVLACARTCDAAFTALIAQGTFDVDQGDFDFRPVAGGSSLTDGYLTFSAPETWLISMDQFAFGSVFACAEVEVSFGDVDASSAFLFGLRGTDYGTLLRLRAQSGMLHLVTFEPALTMIDSAPIAIPTGGASARFVLLSFVSDGDAHGEALRLDTDELAVVHGAYFGGRSPLDVELSFSSGSGSARVDWVKVGRPTPQALTILEPP